jgi:hypothetical protein
MIEKRIIVETPEDKRQDLFVKIALKIMNHPQFQQVLNIGAVQDEWLETTAKITKKVICAMDEFEKDVRANGFEVKEEE